MSLLPLSGFVRGLLVLGVLLLTAINPVAAAQPLCPRAMSMAAAAIEAEAVCLLQKYVQIDTTNPPGNELISAQFLESFLAAEGIEAQLFESAPGRANLYARLRGDGSAKALMLVHHMDVVPAEPEQWTVPPFAAQATDGYLWGRGALDNKGPGIMEVLSVVMLKRLQIPLTRDIVLLAVADEEQGGGKGARYMMEKHADLFADVEFALNEGGAMLQLEDGRMLYAVEFAQKVPLWLKLTASGPAGHASLPSPDAATHRLIRALSRLEKLDFPIVVVPEVQQVFTARAATMPADQRMPYLDLTRSLAEPAFRAEFEKDARNAAMVRNTLAITMLSGSNKENVFPAHASAVLDLRLLPGQDPQVVTAEIEKVMNEPDVQVETLLSSRAHSSPLDTTLYRAIAALIKRRDESARLTANFISGFTDCNTFRANGITCYGFMPMLLPRSETERVHGRDERISIEELRNATLLLHQLVRDVAGR